MVRNSILNSGHNDDNTSGRAWRALPKLAGFISELELGQTRSAMVRFGQFNWIRTRDIGDRIVLDFPDGET